MPCVSSKLYVNHELLPSRAKARFAWPVTDAMATSPFRITIINRRRVHVSEQKNECLAAAGQVGLCRARDTITGQQVLRRGGRNRAGLDFAQNFAQHGSQLFAAHLALAELHAHMKRLILGAIVEQKRLRTPRGFSLFLPRTTSRTD